MMKPLLLLSAAVLFATTATPASGKTAQEPAAGGSSSPKVVLDPQARAKIIYARDCAMCHGASGNGQTGMAKDLALGLHDWTDAKALADRQDQELFTIIRHGKDKMPLEDKDRASDAEVNSLILYIRGFAKQAASATPNPTR
jgi:mono/diheme cytochrome c family protein